MSLFGVWQMAGGRRHHFLDGEPESLCGAVYAAVYAADSTPGRGPNCPACVDLNDVRWLNNGVLPPALTPGTPGQAEALRLVVQRIRGRGRASHVTVT